MPPYSWAWSGPDGFTSTELHLSALKAGTYILTITDAQGCSAVHEYVVSHFSEEPLEVTHVLVCQGAASIGLRGGTPPYWAIWQHTSDSILYFGTTIYQPQPGIYHVTVYDTVDCSLTLTVEIPADAPPCTRITGRVQYDKNQNCQADPAENGLAAWILSAQGANGTFYGFTDASGVYNILVPEGDYTVRLHPQSPLDVICQNDQPVQLNQSGDVAVADFLVQSPECSRLSVDLTTPLLRRCFSNNFYYVRYCNNSLEPVADAYIELELDPLLALEESQRPFSALGNNTFRFALDTLPPRWCGQFWVRVSVSCQAVLGQSHCTKARILPDTLCDPINPLWSGAHLEVRSQCTGDSLFFLLRNIGNNPMSQPLEYIVIEDGIMFRQGSAAPLNAGETMPIGLPANGSTWRLEAAQEPYSPRSDLPILSVEGCTTSGPFSTGFLAQFPTGENRPWEDVDCTANIGAYDPNDKQAFPLGYGNEHYIRPGTELEYLIRFQNTGTDTAFTVIIRDTLPSWLDPLTVRPGASSHPYRFDLYGPGILVFEFQNIMLPDSNTNEPASHGFVKFRVRPRANTPLETDILNSAAIYFDYNEPVITNTVQHRIGENFLRVSTWTPLQPQYAVHITPHPVAQSAVLTLSNAPERGRYQLRLWDASGRLAYEASADEPRFLLRADALPSGYYTFSLMQESSPVGSGTVVVQRR